VSKYLKTEEYKILKTYLRKNKTNKNINYKYYNSIVSYKLKNYNESVASVESILVKPNTNNLLTPTQNLTMLEVYLESLYEIAAPKRFRKNMAALVNDLRRNEGERYMGLVERADYLYVESLFSEQKVDYTLLKRKTAEFNDENKTSLYNNRISYLKGVSLLKTNEEEIGTKVLEELMTGKDVPEYLKGLARTELSSLKLKNRTL
jgi:hypothetical protein